MGKTGSFQNMTKENFIGKVVNDLLEDGFSLVLHQQKQHAHLGGSFNGHDKEFVVSIKGKLGFEVLIHEYCHYLQWKERKRYYNKLINGCSIVFDWLDGTFFKKKIIDFAFDYAIELEWDCERRAVDIIKKYNLDVDIENYCRSANAYILFYHIARENRKWCKEGIYSNALLNSLPSELMELHYYLNSDNIKEHQRKKYIKVLE